MKCCPEIIGVCQNECVLHVQLTPSGQRSHEPLVKKKKGYHHTNYVGCRVIRPLNL